jgi:hypothetical protein
MAKTTGLGDNLYVGAFDISGDINSLSTISGGPAAIEMTGINKSAIERLGGLRDGQIEFMSFMNPAAGAAHPVLSALPVTDVLVSYVRGPGVGNPAACLVSKQVNYDPTRSEKGELTIKTTASGNAFGLEWGEQLTAGLTSISSAGAQSSVDYGALVGTTNFGLQAYLHVSAFTGTSATIAIQSSSDNAVGDPFSDVSGAVFSTVTAVGFQRIQTGPTQAVERYLRANVTGTFSALTFAVVVVRNLTSVSF